MEITEFLSNKLKKLEPLSNFDIEKILNNNDIYENFHLLNYVLNDLRLKRKQLSVEKKTCLNNFSEGVISQESVKKICNKYELIVNYISILEKKNFEIKKKIKSKRLQLLHDEKFTKQKKYPKNNQYNYKKLNIELEKQIVLIIENNDNINQLVYLINKFEDTINKLIIFYNDLGKFNYISKIEDLNNQLYFLEKIRKLIFNEIGKENQLINSHIEFLISSDNFINQREIEVLKCFILKIKQLYIENIKLYNNGKQPTPDYMNYDIQTIDKIINSLDMLSKSFEPRIKKDENSNFEQKNNIEDIDSLRNIIFNSDLESLINIINNNPTYFLLKNDNQEYLFEEYLNYVKNRIINSDVKNEELYEFSSRILEILKLINKGDYLELENIYNKFLHQFSNTIDNLKSKCFDKSRLEAANNFLKMISIECNHKKNVDFDKFVEKIFPYYFDKKSIISDFCYEYIITIDNNEAKLLDTAYSFRKDKHGNYNIGIYIKDVNELLEEIDLELLYKNFIRNKRMFNHEFAFQYLSLSINKNYHKVIGHHFKLDKNFNVKSMKMKKEIIAVSRNLKYDEVREIIISDRNEHLKEILKLYHLIGNNISESKRKYSLYNNVGIDTLNHNFMMLFNYYMASFCKYNHIPSIFLTDKYYTNKTIRNQIPYSKYSCPARNFVSLINQLIYGIYTYTELEQNDAEKIMELLENYVINLNIDSHDPDLKKAKNKVKK